MRVSSGERTRITLGNFLSATRKGEIFPEASSLIARRILRDISLFSGTLDLGLLRERRSLSQLISLIGNYSSPNPAA